MTLPRAWRQWAKARSREIVAAGVPRATARKLAADEAEARAEIARLVGPTAAMEAPLSAVHGTAKGGNLHVRFSLDVDPALIERGPPQ